MPKSNFIIILVCGALTLAVPLVFGHDILASISALTVLSILFVTINFSFSRLLLFLLVFFAGPVSEIIAIYAGAWTYTYPSVFGIPLWLPFVWGNASLYIIDWYTFIDAYRKNSLKKAE
jgi:uncharacterized membrane protein YoaT (DUF817 family)